MSFDGMVAKLKARYLPTQNKTLANFEFRKLRQRPLETHDGFMNRVKHEANFCDFSCGPACTVRDKLIRDQVVYGTADEEIQKAALNGEWTLEDLQTKGRKLEAAAFGAGKLKKEKKASAGGSSGGTADVGRAKFGKFSRKGGNGQSVKCRNCSNKSCVGGNKCFAHGRECFDCGEMNHMRGAENCKKKKKQKMKKKKHSEKTNRVAENQRDGSGTSSSSSSESEEEESGINRLRSIPARFVAHVRRAVGSRSKPKKVVPRYQVPVVIKETEVAMFADTGADVSVIPKSLADQLDLSLVKTKMRIKPYGSKKRIRCVGYYVGPIRYGEEIANVGMYVVKGNVEPLLSGPASEALGVISFHGDIGVRRSGSDEVDPAIQVYMIKYPSIFTGVGKMKGVKVKFHIDHTVPPVACPIKPVPYHVQPKLDRAIQKMEEAGVVEDHEGPAPWLSNLVLAPKDDGDLRVTADMREPNKAILDTGLPIPRAEDIRKEFVGCIFFTKLDFRTAFHQLELDEESRILTVFPHNGKLKRHTRLTMGAKPASGELNKALRPLFNNLPQVHIIHDDLVIATADEEEHEEVIDNVLAIIEEANLTLNPDKCLFKRKKIPFWGMTISGDGVHPDTDKVQALRDATHPESKSELMSFLCMLQANGEFIPRLSKETAHLRELTQKNVRFKWTKKCQAEFERLKNLLCENALLTYYDISLPTYIMVDAHKTGISAILAQGPTIQTAKIVSCASRATSPVERRYPQLDLEALAVDFGLRRFRQYVVGGPQVTVVTDHKPLVSIFRDTRRGSVRTDRIKLRHQDVNYSVVFQRGKDNIADFLSRHATKWDKIPTQWKEETEELEKVVFFLNFSPYSDAVSIPRIIKETAQDETLQKLKEYVRKGAIPKSAGAEWKKYRGILDTITVSDTGLLLKDEKIILPKSLWGIALDKAHQGGHPGETRMKSRVRSHFWVPELNSLVKDKVSSCDTCQRFTGKTTREPMAAQKTTGVGWEEVSIDLFGPLPNKKHVLVVQDSMSRFPDAKIVPNTSAGPVIAALDDVYSAYGHPQRHRSDNGPPFNSHAFSDYSTSKGIEHVLTYPHHPQGNPCETFMKPLGKALKAAIYNRDSAQKAVNELLQSYRTTPHPATGLAPGDMLFRYGYRSEFPSNQCSEKDVVEAVERDREQKFARTSSINESSKRRKSDYHVGDKVLLKVYPKGSKFEPLYGKEVMTVVHVEDKGVVVVGDDGGVKRRHKDDIKAYCDRGLSLWPDSEEDDFDTGTIVQAEGLADGQATEGQIPLAPPVDDNDAPALPGPSHSRPTRQRKLPPNLADYVVYGDGKRKGGK